MHGRNRNRRRYRSRTYIVVLFGLSITAMLLPASWTSGLIGLVQILVPFQHAAGGALDAITPSSSLDNTPVPAERHRAVTLERDALQHQVAALTLQIARLGREVEGLTRSRMWNALGNPLGAAGRLIPAGVITDDLLPWRDSRLINAGSLRGVQRGDAVTSSCFPVDVGQAEGVRSGLAIVLQEVLVGTVEQVTTHTARVRLLSDPDVGRKVRLVRAAEDGMQPFDGAFWLRGRGHGVMAIHDVNRRDVADGLIAVGDLVLSDPDSDSLPAAMVIGNVAAIQPDHDHPMLAILRVESGIDPTTLRRLYVYDPSPTGEPAEARSGRASDPPTGP